MGKEKYELAEVDYKKGMKYKDIAEKYDVSINTVKSWKTRKWGKEKSVHTKNKSVHTKGNDPKQQPQRKRSGNPNPSQSFPKRNKAAEVHGFFSKFLPDETLEIIDAMNESSPADLIWDQIQIQYAAIIRAQSVMFVKSKEELVKELKKAKYDYVPHPENDDELQEILTEAEYEIQFAWDRQATFLNAQSRAMGELRSSIKQFLELSDEYDERRMKLEQMQLNIEKTKTDIEKTKQDMTKDDVAPIEITIRGFDES